MFKVNWSLRRRIMKNSNDFHFKNSILQKKNLNDSSYFYWFFISLFSFSISDTFHLITLLRIFKDKILIIQQFVLFNFFVFYNEKKKKLFRSGYEIFHGIFDKKRNVDTDWMKLVRSYRAFICLCAPKFDFFVVEGQRRRGN